MAIFKKIGLAVAAVAALFGPQAKAAGIALHDGTFDGGTYDALYGPVQVELTIKSGQVVDAKTLQFPNHRRTSVEINNAALPVLQREVVQSQSAKVRLVSGATLTSRAYVSSVADAIKQAGN